jgi:hypothetical protein
MGLVSNRPQPPHKKMLPPSQDGFTDPQVQQRCHTQKAEVGKPYSSVDRVCQKLPLRVSLTAETQTEATARRLSQVAQLV